MDKTWTDAADLLHTQTWNAATRRPWPKNRPKHHGERRKHTASLILQLGTRRLGGQLHALAALPLGERIVLTEEKGGKAREAV